MAKPMQQQYLDNGQLTRAGRELQQTVLDHAQDGKTQMEIAEELGIDRKTIANLRFADPAFRDELERVMYDASSTVVEDIRQVPYIELDPQRARVKLDALSRYLELRWPRRYGKRMDITVRSLDMGKALADARARQAQVIDSTAKDVTVLTDSESVRQQDSALSAALEHEIADLLGDEEPGA